MNRILLKTAGLIVALSVFSAAQDLQAANYPENKAPLKPSTFLALPLGSVKAEGWLLEQLRLQRDGLTGHLPEVMKDVGPTSGWLGGDGENWEKGPYYVKGLLALAYTLDDAKLKEEVQPWIEWCLQSQREDGFFGPTKNNDWWPRMVMTHVLREYAEATGDKRVEPFLLKYYAHMLKNLPTRPLEHWGKSRAGDEMETVVWLYNRTGEKSLLDLAKLLHDQAYPWVDIFTKNGFMEFGEDFQPKHNVNVPQAMKFPAVWYEVSGKPADAASLAAGLNHLQRDHGLTLGMNGGTEFLAGRSTTQGIETCSVVEKMLSMETAERILGDPKYGDVLELAAFNALPGAMTKNIKQIVYYSLPNNVRAVDGPLGFNQDYANGITPAVPSGFPCCIYNFHMGWPKFTQNTWAATPDGGLAAMAYAPTKVTAKVGNGVEATIEEKTQYPFGDSIVLEVTVPQGVNFPLVLRIPAWTAAPSVSVNGTAEAGVKPGTFHRIAREWNTGDKVEIRFPMATRTVAGMNNSVSVVRGPLIYTLKLNEAWKVREPKPNGFDTLEVETDSPWNYGLVLGGNPDAAFKFEDLGPSPNPFNPTTPAVKLIAKAKRLPNWRMAWNERVAFDPPTSPVASDSQAEDITLVPAGTQMLRVTSFPWIGSPKPAPRSIKPDFAKEGLSNWIPYGGGWFVKDGAIIASSNGGSNGTAGGKAVATGADFADLTYEADVTAGDKGDAGLIFRVKDPGIGADAYMGYFVGLRPATKQIFIGKADGGWHEIAFKEAGIEANKAYKIKVAAKGPKIDIYLDDATKPVISVKDDSFKSGAVGVRQWYPDSAKTWAVFDKIRADAM